MTSHWAIEWCNGAGAYLHSFETDTNILLVNCLQPKLSLPAAQRVVNGEWATGVCVEGREGEGQSPRQAKTSQIY